MRSTRVLRISTNGTKSDALTPFTRGVETFTEVVSSRTEQCQVHLEI